MKTLIPYYKMKRKVKINKSSTNIKITTLEDALTDTPKD